MAVDIVAAGVCHSDLHVVRGEWPVPVPTVLGHEGSGVVSSVGPGVSDLAVGDHVVLSWVASCGQCRYCRDGRPVQCARYAEVVAPGGVLLDGTSRITIDGAPAHHYLGVSSFAERVVVPATGAVKVRKDAPLDLLALVGCAVATGVGAVRNTADVPGRRHRRGHRLRRRGAVLCPGGEAGRSRAHRRRRHGAGEAGAARKLGATDVLDAGQPDVVTALRSLVPEGLDYVFDAIGKVTTTEQAIAALGLGGAAVIVGLPPAGSQRGSIRFPWPKATSGSSGPTTARSTLNATSPCW